MGSSRPRVSTPGRAKLRAAPTRNGSSRPATRTLWPLALLGAALVVALALVVAHGGGSARAAPLTLQLWPAGKGRIDVQQNAVTVGSCDFVDVLQSTNPCSVTVDSGSPVTLTAAAEPDAPIPPAVQNDVPDFQDSMPGTAFVRWSRYGCGASPSCTFTPDTNGDWLTAVFSPLQLEVGISGDGTVAVQGGAPLACSTTLGFGDTTCHGLFPADSSVTLVATPTTSTDAINWGSGCIANGATCTVDVTNIRTFASVGFGADPAPDFPFKITPTIRVVDAGSGSGTVTGGGIDCGSTCAAPFDYQARVTLQAQAAPGSTFATWAGVCSDRKSVV